VFSICKELKWNHGVSFLIIKVSFLTVLLLERAHYPEQAGSVRKKKDDGDERGTLLTCPFFHPSIVTHTLAQFLTSLMTFSTAEA
jgi:hypothetical protein